MSPRKLTDQDKEELLVAYRETAETTSTLAARYGVSSSTVSRFLKSRLSPAEYEELIQQKRLGRGSTAGRGEKSAPESPEPTPKRIEKPKLVKRKTEPALSPEPEAAPQESSPSPGRRRIRRKASVPEPSPALAIDETPTLTDEMLLEGFADEFDETEYDFPPSLDELEDLEALTDDEEEFDDDLDFEDEDPRDSFEAVEVNPNLLALAQEIQLGDRQQALKELLGDDGEFDEDEDEDDEFDEDEDDEDLDLTPVSPSETVEILPLEAAQFPRTCYIVTDRMSELIARPLQEFQDLGHIPDTEISQKTLPVFDNHRVAKRFIRGRTQKIIKVPNGEIFFKTSGCLAAKGITRLLLDGKIYQLS
ncbi:MAG: hypothetical protein VKJ86_09790 [Synechococcus sp.]|nr:hypothetical protein [Synechococcus sp.]